MFHVYSAFYRAVTFELSCCFCPPLHLGSHGKKISSPEWTLSESCLKGWWTGEWANPRESVIYSLSSAFLALGKTEKHAFHHVTDGLIWPQMYMSMHNYLDKFNFPIYYWIRIMTGVNVISMAMHWPSLCTDANNIHWNSDTFCKLMFQWIMLWISFL